MRFDRTYDPAALLAEKLRRCRRIVNSYGNRGIPGTAKIFGITEREIRDHHSARCDCPGPLALTALRPCAAQGHVERPGPWGTVCAYCGVPLPERPERVDGEGGHWRSLGDEGSPSRIWVPE